GVGHVRYPTAGCSSSAEAQPFYVNSPYGISLAHNGNLTNADELARDLFHEDLRHMNTDSDSEILLNVFAHELQTMGKLKIDHNDVFNAVAATHKRCRGAYAVVAMITGYGIVGFRDPHGIRPIVYGKRDALSVARNEDWSTVLQRFSREEISKAPRSFSKHIKALKQTQFKSSDVRDGLASVTLQDGHIFYGYKSKPNHLRAFEYVKDIVPRVLSADTFLLGLDIAQRYATDFSWPPASILPPKGGTLVECGAYLGHKTIRFAEELVGRGGKVLAIEMMPDNAEILRRNIRENGLEDVIDVIEAGVWNEAGTLPVKGKGRQRNSLLEIDKLNENREILARVDTLDVLLQEWGQPHVDLVFMTINGAEVEALQGMNPSLGIVKAMFIAAPYTRDGRPSGDICAEIAKAKGCKILKESSRNRLFITTPYLAVED
ncbi:FkbM family methyltransferase, partial [Candidatus Kaiserbacteria bacterium]|nr:FkbM family methyltransferase [Candidatus Kaiserbacteria bacterium]